MNIAMFTNVYKPFIGGVPVSIERLAKGLKELGHNVYVFAPEYPDKETDDNNVIRCKLITFYGNDKFDIPVADIFSRDLRAKFLEMDIDIVHVHQPVWMGQRGVRLAELKDIPVVFTYHTHYEEYLHIFKLTKPMFSKGFKRKMRTARDYIIGKDLPSGTKLKRYFKYKILPIYLKYFISTCNGVIFPTDSMRKWVGRIGVPSYILPTGLEESAYRDYSVKAKEIREKYIGNKEHLFISVSRISKEKNIEFIINGISVLKQKIGDTFRVMIIGSGDMTDELKQLAEEKDISNNVLFLGRVDNEELPAYYAASDLFLFASLTETQGIVLLEAMAQGIPVVAVNATGVSDMIADGKNGYLCMENKNDWCNMIIKAMDDKSLKQGARQTAEEYNHINIAERAESIYRDMIDTYKEGRR